MNSFRLHLLAQGSSIRQALERLNLLARDAILFIVDPDDHLVGSLTDGDVRRGLLRGKTIEEPVDSIIQPNPRFFRKGDQNIHQVIEYRNQNFRIIPILDQENRVVNVINFREVKSFLPLDAVIMAGGRGERLRPLTDDLPKPLLKVGGKPILEHNLDRLRSFGLDSFRISVRYRGEQIENYFGNGEDRSIRIRYIRELNPMGTIGSLALVTDWEHQHLLVTNSDLLTNLDYEHFFLDFIQQDADLSVLSIPYAVDIPYAVLETSNGKVLNLKEKPTFTYYSNGGIYLMKREVIGHIPNDRIYHATDLIEDLIRMGKKVVSFPLAGYWLDIGKHEDYAKAQRDIELISLK